MIKGMATIILPVYNVEKYLNRCIYSIVNQTYKKLEIILVDDGSLDYCPKMCDEWSEKDSRIKVIHKENEGVGMARNTGIDIAHGEYIFFFDSDDYVEFDIVEKVFQVANRTNAELIIYGHKDVDSNGRIKRTVIPFSEKEYFEGEEIQNNFLPDMIASIPEVSKNGNIWMSAWASAYKYSFIHRAGFRFVSENDIISEDVYSLLCLMKNVSSIAVMPSAFYFYCENETSLTHIYRIDRYTKIKQFYYLCIGKCDELGYNSIVKERLSNVYLSFVIAAMKIIVKSDLNIKEKKKNIREIVNDELMQKIIHQINNQNESLMRMLLLSAIRCRYSEIVYWMVKAKT